MDLGERVISPVFFVWPCLAVFRNVGIFFFRTKTVFLGQTSTEDIGG